MRGGKKVIIEGHRHEGITRMLSDVTSMTLVLMLYCLCPRCVHCTRERRCPSYSEHGFRRVSLRRETN